MEKPKSKIEVDTELKKAAEKILLFKGISLEAAVERILGEIVKTNETNLISLGASPQTSDSDGIPPLKSWLVWVAENLERGCAPDAILRILLKNNLSSHFIREAMGAQFPVSSSLIKDFAIYSIDHRALANVKITKPRADLSRVDTEKMQLYVFTNFIKSKEIDRLIPLIQSNMRPSLVTDDGGDRKFRTSTTTDLGLLDHPLIREIDARIANALGLSLIYAESTQAQIYKVGQEFKPHTDYFKPGTSEYVKYASELGNRSWTFMVYLKAADEGGGTQFTNIGKSFRPNKGTAIIWNNLYEDGSVNPDTIHSGCPVERGEKIIITKWFRERAH